MRIAEEGTCLRKVKLPWSSRSLPLQNMPITKDDPVLGAPTLFLCLLNKNPTAALRHE